jgi:hypothetical protein
MSYGHTECCTNGMNCETSTVAWTEYVLADRNLLTEMVGRNFVFIPDLSTSIYVIWLYSPFVGPWALFQFLNPIHYPYDSLEGDQPVVRPVPTHRTTQTQNKLKQTSMP